MSDPRDQHDPSDPLRDRLRSADPAAGLPPEPPERVAARLERTTSDDRVVESRSDGTRGRSRLTWLVAAAAVVLIAAGVGFAVVDRGSDDPGGAGTAAAPPQADGSDGSDGSDESTGGADDPAGADGTVTDLRLAGGAPVGRCAPPSPDVVELQDVAVDAVVTSISAGQVTLAPTRFYTGEQTDQVVVQETSDDLQALLSAVDFVDGERYLVSASDGQVTLCGLSAAWSPDLAGVYEQAFPS